LERKKILVIGSLNMDMVVRMPRMPEIGETIMGTSFMTVPGGKGANQAYAAAKLGGKVAMLGATGTDEYGKQLIQGLSEAGVNVENIYRCPETHTGIASIHVNQDGNNCIVVVPGANYMCSVDQIAKQMELIEQCDILILQLEIPIEAVQYAVKAAKERKKTVILNPAPAPDRIPDDFLEKIDILTPNETELQRLTGHSTGSLEEIVEASHVLLDRGVKTLVVTWGSKGAVLITGEKHQLFHVASVKAVDTTAAGDSFTAALAVAMSEGKSMEDAIQFANKVATIVVTRLGARTSIPFREELEE